MTLRYERDSRGVLTSNGRRDARLDALALIEADLEYRPADMTNLLTETNEADLLAVSFALATVAVAALREADGDPFAVLRAVRLRIIEED